VRFKKSFWGRVRVKKAGEKKEISMGKIDYFYMIVLKIKRGFGCWE